MVDVQRRGMLLVAGVVVASLILGMTLVAVNYHPNNELRRMYRIYDQVRTMSIEGVTLVDEKPPQFDQSYLKYGEAFQWYEHTTHRSFSEIVQDYNLAFEQLNWIHQSPPPREYDLGDDTVYYQRDFPYFFVGIRELTSTRYYIEFIYREVCDWCPELSNDNDFSFP